MQFILPYAGGDLRGKCWCAADQTSTAKKFLFSVLRTLEKLKKFWYALLCRRGKAKFDYGFTRRKPIVPKFLDPFKGKQKIKFFWKKACCISCCMNGYFGGILRFTGRCVNSSRNKKSRTTKAFADVLRFLALAENKGFEPSRRFPDLLP